MQTKLNEYYNLKTALLSRLTQYDAATLNAKPANGGWSVLQVCEHLYKAEENMIVQLSKKAEKADSFAPIAVKVKVRYGVMWCLFQLPILRFKAPDFVATLTENHTLAAVTAHWEATHTALAQALTVLPAPHLQKALFTHPAIGRIDTDYMLRFMILHTERHIAQINKIIATR
jgi:uncharacterized damage-inducible protein DinB